jgi:hypothetical protein
MRTDTLIRNEGMLALNERLNVVEVERFITLLIREPFDYTEWQRNLYEGMTVAELSEKADALWQEAHSNIDLT